MIKETINNEVEDHYQDHSQHNNYDEKCSECFKNVKEFDGDDSDIDICKNCSVPCEMEYCYACQYVNKLNEDSCEVEQGRDDYDPTLE